MPGKRKITISTLADLGPPKLAALLLAEAAGNKQLKQAIELAISAKKGPEILAADVRKRLASFAKSRSSRLTREAARSSPSLMDYVR